LCEPRPIGLKVEAYHIALALEPRWSQFWIDTNIALIILLFFINFFLGISIFLDSQLNGDVLLCPVNACRIWCLRSTSIGRIQITQASARLPAKILLRRKSSSATAIRLTIILLTIRQSNLSMPKTYSSPMMCTDKGLNFFASENSPGGLHPRPARSKDPQPPIIL
jgi:hypothetical protein